METQRLKSLLETLIFVAEKPIKTSELWQAVESYLQSQQELSELSSEEASSEENSENIQEDLQEDTAEEVKQASPSAAEQLQAKAESVESELGKADITKALREMAEEMQADETRGLILVEVAGGWQFRTRPKNAAIVRCLYQPKPTRISKPSLETLSIVAYRQPITRVEIDEIRGVDSGGVLKTLCEKNLVRIVGKKDEPGKPMLYGTTAEFLELFQLKNLKDLPTLKDYRDLEAEFQKQQMGEGVLTEAEEQEEDAEVSSSLLDLAVAGEMSTLDPEEESILEDLEENIKEVRHLEKEIFVEEKTTQEDIPQNSETS